jgi:hypothetical protein
MKESQAEVVQIEGTMRAFVEIHVSNLALNLTCKLITCNAIFSVEISDDEQVVNDTVVADPLFTVPILVSEEDLRKVGAPKLSLCYEVHGIAGSWFNFITDMCTNVNAHYAEIVPDLNIVDQIGVIAVNDKKECVEIKVNVVGCTAEVKGVTVTLFKENGISVKRYQNRVRIAVPNCAEQMLVMWVICEKRTLTNPDTFVGIPVNAIKFVVKRGLNFGHFDSHGLIGIW